MKFLRVVLSSVLQSRRSLLLELIRTPRIGAVPRSRPRGATWIILGKDAPGPDEKHVLHGWLAVSDVHRGRDLHAVRGAFSFLLYFMNCCVL